MKKTLKRTLSLVLCLLLVAPWTMLSPVFAAETITLLPGQKLLPVTPVDVSVIQDGLIEGAEYGSAEPILRLTADGGFWAEDMNGNKLTENLPEYIDLYLARYEKGIFAGIVVEEKAHDANEYLLDVFMGFGDDTNAYTMNTGNTTGYTMKHMTRASYLREWWDMRATSLGAKIVSADGTETESKPYFDKLYEYVVPNWGEVRTAENGNKVATYEVELSFKDSLIGSGKEFTEVPEIGYFGFDLALYSGKERCGTLHFNTDLTGEENSPKSAPHVLDLAGNVEVDPNSKIADLASLSIERGVITPDFDANTYNYNIIMPYGYAIKVNAEAKAAEAGAKVEIFGAEALGKDGDGVVTVICTAASGYQKTYKINVKRDYIQSEFAAEGTDGLNALFAQFAEMEWSAADSVVIKLSGEVTSSEALLLGQKTFFNELGTKLPIVIDGAGEAVINLTGEKIVSANDITFRNLKMNAGSAQVYAGAGKLVFENVEFDEAQTASFFGDTDSLAPFAGWKTENLVKSLINKLLDTSITFKGTTKYTPEGVKMGAAGFDGEEFEAVEGVSISLTPEKIRASFVIDGAEVSSVGARVGTAPVAEATVEMKSGKAQTLAGDALTYTSENVETYKGKTFVTVSGGTVEGGDGLRGISSALHKGNVYVSVSEADAVTAPTVISEVKVNYGAEIAGNTYLNIAGGTILGDVVGGGANLTTYNTVTGGTVKGSFYGVGEQSAKKIVNTISGGTFVGTAYGGSYGVAYVRGIENNISGGTFQDAFFGGSRSGSVDGNIKNNVSGGTFTHTNPYKAQTDYPDLVLQPCFAGGNLAGVVNGNVTNNITGGDFLRTFAGSGDGDVNGNVVNNLSGLVAIKDCFYGGSSRTQVNVVSGQIINNVSANEEGASPAFSINYTTGSGISYQGGGLKTHVGKGIINNFYAGTSNHRYFGGTEQGGGEIDNAMGKNSDGYSVVNNIFGGTFAGEFNGAGIGCKVEGNVLTNITGGTFKKDFTAGGRFLALDGKDQKIELNISGGTFNAALFPASYGYTAAHKSTPVNRVEITISGGTFGSTVYMGGRGNTPMPGGSALHITGGTFKGAIVCGSESKASEGACILTVEPKDTAVRMEKNIILRSNGGKAILKGSGGALLLGANSSLTFDEYDGATQKVTLTETSIPAHTYLSVPAESANGITFEGEVPMADGVWKTPAAE